VHAAHVVELKQPPRPVAIDDADGLRIEAVALNPLDLAVANGIFYGGHPPLPYVPGCEAAARTEDGALVYLFGEGRGVRRDGFLAERVDLPAELTLRLPDGVEPALAAAAGIAGVAAWVSVVWKAKATPEDRVLVLGGTGTVGKIAAQAAKLLGAQTIVAVGRKELDRIPEEFGHDGFTVCIDPVWGEPLANALAHAAPRARIVHLGQSAGPESPLRSGDVRGKELNIQGHSSFMLTPEEQRRAYLELLDHLAAGRITLDYETFALDDVAAAWEHQRGGKSVVVM
jgi:NADPH:quinone reductase-like Zn-dependent oxidoreductase